MISFHPMFSRGPASFPNRSYGRYSGSNHQKARPALWLRIRAWFASIHFHSLPHPFPSRIGSNTTILSLAREKRRSAEAIEILAVGVDTWGKPALDAMRANSSFRLCATDDLRTLWLIPKQPSIHVIVLHSSLSPDQLEDVCRLARQRWPRAKVLVVRAGEEFLEDALYDERIFPTADPHTLIASIERLAGSGHKGGSINDGR